MSSSLGKKATVPTSKKRKGVSSFSGPTAEAAASTGPAIEQVQLANAIRALLTIDPWEHFFGIIEPSYLEPTMELCSTFHLQTMMMNYDDPGTVQFYLSRLICQLSVPEFGTALGLYTEEFKEVNDLHALNRHIHRSPSRCWDPLVPGGATYNLSLSKASALPPSLRHLHTILAHTTTGSTATQESSLALFGQMSPQGILSMLSMRMIKKCRGTYPPQYCLAQSTKEEAYEDIPDDVLPQHEDPLTQPPPPSRPVHAICQHLHISSPIPPREPSSDEEDLWTNEPLPPPEYPPPPSHRLLSKTLVQGIHHTGSFTSPPIL
ncbi:hypothetical protein GOBAR_AA36488 [Gossypium barbadense]|uniref:Uncharacterized protein n=1 Tax=Gossypium barbadense TaxID=3634 RepID=A0A2P5VZG9_GOSBA|nr:hypothetical protein GOBAR_AA36488 [Gossypium barbadense]